jgi:hypothetical protein
MFRVAVVGLVVLAYWPFDSAIAEVYRCAEKGRTVYQDYPCTGGGAVVHAWPADNRAPAGGADALSRLKANVTEMEQARAARENAAQIEGIEREIQGYEQAEQGELAALRARQDYANYNLHGAVWERAWVMDAIAKEMQAVTEKYAAKKQAARERIAALSSGRQPSPGAR